MKSPTSPIRFRNAVGIVLALSAIFAVVISSITLQKDSADAQVADMDTDAIEARAKAWFNSLTLDEAINVLLGSTADADPFVDGRQYLDGHQDPQIIDQPIEFIATAHAVAMADGSTQTFYDALPANSTSDDTDTDPDELLSGDATKVKVKSYVDGATAGDDVDDIYAVGNHLGRDDLAGITPIRGFQSIELWWNYSACVQKRIAVGEDNTNDASSSYCSDYAGMSEELRARAKMAGMAILGEGTVELNSELEVDEVAAARWWNVLDGPQMLKALWGTFVASSGDPDLGQTEVSADRTVLTQRMYADIGEPISAPGGGAGVPLDAASMARATAVKNLINDRFVLISGGSYESAEEWWGSIGCLEMNIAVGADNEPSTDTGFCVGFDELSPDQDRNGDPVVISARERVLKVGNAILGLPGLPRVADWWDTLNTEQMVNVVYGKHDGDGTREYTSEQKMFQTMYDELSGGVVYSRLSSPTVALLGRHNIDTAPGFNHDGLGGESNNVDHDDDSSTPDVLESTLISVKLVVDKIATEIFDPPPATTAWILAIDNGTFVQGAFSLVADPVANPGSAPVVFQDNDKYDPPHESVVDWWETLDCRGMRTAVGEDNNYLNAAFAGNPQLMLDPMDPEESIYCAHFPGYGSTKLLMPEARERVFEVGAALLGLSIEEAKATRPSENSKPTGSVTIGGTPQVGADLVANIDNVMDPDGMQGEATFTWYHADGDGMRIGDSIGTGKTYTLQSSDAGKNIIVVATYTDGQSFPESIQGSLPSDVEILGSAGEISKIEPAISGLTVSPGDEVKLSVLVYGLQGIQDNSLVGSSSMITWSVGGDSLDETGVEIMYTAPSSPGTYMVTASLDQSECLPDNEDEKDAACSAEFKVTVQRTSPPPPAPEAPKNPPGEIPAILTDSDGNQYEVFTPEGGGSFTGEGFNVTAEPGVIPNGEFIGIRISEDGPASNMGMTQHRYTLGGSMYTVSAVDATGAAISSYALRAPATVCLPLPDELRHNISNLALVTINADGTQTVLSASVRLGSAGTHVCGNLSSLPASVAVASAGSPAPLPTPVPPTATPVPPDTGGLAPASSAGMALWALLFGIGVVTVGTFLLLGTARARNRKTQS